MYYRYTPSIDLYVHMKCSIDTHGTKNQAHALFTLHAYCSFIVLLYVFIIKITTFYDDRLCL